MEPARRGVLACILVVSACAGPSSAERVSSTPFAAQSTLAPPTRAPSSSPIVSLSQVFHPLTNGWRPSGPTLLVVTTEDARSTLVAVPFDVNGPRGAAVPLLSFVSAAGFDIRADGGAVAVVIAGPPATRIATWDIGSGRGGWVSLDDPGAVTRAVWSLDGGSLYYISNRSIDSAVVARVPAAGGAATTIATLDRYGDIQGVTPDGKGLIWSRGQAGGSTDILDIASAVNRHLADVAHVVSWRAQQPRILLSVGGCCAGRPGGSLVAFDDMTMTSTSIADRGQFSDPAWGGASWDPTGTLVAAGRYDAGTPYDAVLAIIDPATGAVRELGGPGVYAVHWVDEGIIVTRAISTSGAVSGRGSFLVALVSPQGGSSKTLYSGASVAHVMVVRP